MSGGGQPLVAGVICGLRTWRVEWSGDSGRLGGPIYESPWATGGAPTRASCQTGSGRLRRTHHAPVGSCSCGLYALHPRESAVDQLEPALLADDEPRFDSVIGIVDAWGKVEVHEEGFRAEYARPRALAAVGVEPGSDRELLIERLAERHRADVLRVSSLRGLVDHCREHRLGLDEGAVHSLLTDVEEPVAEPFAATRPAAGAMKRRKRRRSIAGRVGNALWTLIIVLLGVAWYGFLAFVGVAFLLAFIGVLDEEPTLTTRDLRVVEQGLIRVDGELVYVAVAENTSSDEVALRVFPRGMILDADGEEVVRVEPRRHVDHRPNLAPGARGLVIDRLGFRRGADPAEAEAYAVELVARREPVPVDPPPQPTFRRAEIEADPCALTALVDSTGTEPRPRVAYLIRSRDGAVAEAGFLRTERIPAGIGRRVLARGEEPCPGFVDEVELFASPMPKELLGP